MSALTEMYVEGVSTRTVKAITEELCGHTFSASTINRINASLDGMLRRFAERRLDEAYPYLMLDARYEKVRLDDVIQSQAVFVAIGINWGRSAAGPRRGAVESGVAVELGDVRHGPEGSRPTRGRVRRLRRPRRAEAGCGGVAARGDLAALLRACSPERARRPAPHGR